MARAVWHDQPDYYTTATLPRFWTVAHADAEVASGMGYGGSLPATAALTGASEDAYVISTATGLSESREFGLGHRINVLTYPAAEKVILGIVATGGTLPASLHCCATLRTDGKVSLWRGNMATLLATSVETVMTGQQLAFGMTGILDNEGALEAWINRDPIVRISGVDTAGGDLAPVWGGVYVGLAPDIFQSHVYAQAGYADLRPGYVVRVLFPTVAQLTGYAPNTGTIPECLDDADADDDTTYIAATALDQRYAVEHDAITDARGIQGARTVALVRNVSGSSPSMTPFVRNADGATDFGDWRSIVATDWRAIDRWYPRSPFTDEPWTPDDINAAGWGGQTDV